MSASVPVLRAKPGVTFAPIEPAGFRILAAIDNLSRVLGLDIWITSGSDSHPPGDPHTTGEAYDVSVKDWTVPVTLKAITFLRQVLGERFTILYECPSAPSDPQLLAIAYVNGQATGCHLHVQRKKGMVYPPDQPVATTAYA